MKRKILQSEYSLIHINLVDQEVHDSNTLTCCKEKNHFNSHVKKKKSYQVCMNIVNDSTDIKFVVMIKSYVVQILIHMYIFKKNQSVELCICYEKRKKRIANNWGVWLQILKNKIILLLILSRLIRGRNMCRPKWIARRPLASATSRSPSASGRVHTFFENKVLEKSLLLSHFGLAMRSNPSNAPSCIQFHFPTGASLISADITKKL